MRALPFTVNIAMALAAVLLAGCGNSKSSSSAPPDSEPALPKTANAVTTAAQETRKAASEAATTVVSSAKTALSDATAKFLSSAKAQGDNVLSSIGQDLAAKAQALVASSPNETVKTNLDAALTSLAQGKDTQALAPAFQVSQGSGLTPQQLDLAKEVGNLASAFVVQRDFSNLSGAQGEVATLVNSLRNGQYSAALPPLQKIWNNASLTPPQKEIVSSLADQYAPSLKQAGGTLQQGLEKLKGLPGVSQ